MKTVRILTIGNSFADNATRYLADMCAAAGLPYRFAKANLGGCPLEKHWNLIKQCDLLPDVRPYPFRYLGGKTVPMNLKDILRKTKWDYVTLQQVSHDSWRPETFEPWFGRLLALVRELAPTATPVIHQTWAYRKDAALLKEMGVNQLRMYRGLKKNYDDMGAKYGLRIIPSGDAFQLARKELAYAPDRSFKPSKARPLDLPDQSRALITGYFWATGNTPSGKAELRFDPRHGNEAGCYLAGAVWYGMFTGQEISKNGYRPESVSKKMQTILNRAAQAAVDAAGGPFSH